MPLPFLGSDSGFSDLVDPHFARDVELGTLVFALSVVQGLFLAHRFRVLILLPVVCLNLAFIVFVWAAARSQDVNLLMEQIAISGIGVQLGYLAEQVAIKVPRSR